MGEKLQDRIYRMLLEEGGEAASAAIMAHKKRQQKNSVSTGDEFLDNAGQRSTLFNTVRKMYCADLNHRTPEYLIQLQEIRGSVSEESKDFAILTRTIEAPLYYQYQQEKEKVSFDDPSVQQRYASLRCCRDEEFYRFKEPQALNDMIKPVKEERRKRQHTNSKTVENADESLEKARVILAALDLTSPDYHDEETAQELCAAVQYVMGRRNAEISLEKTQFFEVPGQPYQIKVQGLAKKKHLPCDDPQVKVYTMPCLAPASQIIKAIEIVRSKLCKGGTRVVKRQKIDNGQTELFGKGTRYLCGEVREIASTQAYKMRTQSDLGKNYSLPMFRKEILGHETLEQQVDYSKCTIKS
jgi:hypothetical protein